MVYFEQNLMKQKKLTSMGEISGWNFFFLKLGIIMNKIWKNIKKFVGSSTENSKEVEKGCKKIRETLMKIFGWIWLISIVKMVRQIKKKFYEVWEEFSENFEEISVQCLINYIQNLENLL